MAPAYLARITRPQLCGRISALRSALDVLAAQAAVDGFGRFDIGRLKLELYALETELHRRDAFLREIECEGRAG